MEVKVTKVLVVPYFGTLPIHFQLWLNSCDKNQNFKWYLLTDCQISEYIFPINVIVEIINLKDLKVIFEKYLKLTISLEQPYKLCDFKPIYWMILDFYKVQYDYWGYCDIDLLFGDLSKFIPDEVILKYDKIYSFGHLTMFRNSQVTKKAYKLEGAECNWAKVFTCEKIFGFDELHGINKIWKKNKLSIYQNECDIADIEPQFEILRLTIPNMNRKGQRFIYDEGHIYQVVFDEKKMIKRITKEFAYIHFQKRNLSINIKFDDRQFEIDSCSFKPIDYLQKHNRALSLKERYRIVVSHLRYYKRKIYNRNLKL